MKPPPFIKKIPGADRKRRGNPEADLQRQVVAGLRQVLPKGFVVHADEFWCVLKAVAQVLTFTRCSFCCAFCDEWSTYPMQMKGGAACSSLLAHGSQPP